MISLKFSHEHANGFLTEDELLIMQDEVSVSHDMLINKTGKGSEFLGWVDLPEQIDEVLLSGIEEDARRIREMAEVFVVIGIGGSYLGARAVIEALNHPFSGFMKKGAGKGPIIVYAGNSISQDYHSALLELLDEKDYALAVISKSGTTTEPAVAFRILKAHLESKYGKQQACERIFSITDQSRGALKKLSNDEGYKTYVIPDDVGGRFSVLTPVGLLPIAVAGYDIRQMVEGAREMRKVCMETPSIIDNPAARYAAIRNSFYRMGKQVEILVNYEPSLMYITEWWKQLYGESEGKDGEGIFPAGVGFTTDLHSMGQYIQDGQRMIFETVITVDQPARLLKVPHDPSDLDGMNFIAGKTMNEVNQMAALGTVLAHIDGEVPNLSLSIPKLNESSIGELLYFFEFACGLSGYLLGVNPFDQPGVEAYKKNMFALLGKPGYEKETEAIRSRISLGE
ncbi:MAG: glucose-6-phosphate isomerase [Bacteroidales bacterium]|nr:glucose-6-phosphate isomerase [Bacteroidales bacterium]MBK7172127.1 glucose-6-phosphate isomerase [Bacteroidales bacterium]